MISTPDVRLGLTGIDTRCADIAVKAAETPRNPGLPRSLPQSGAPTRADETRRASQQSP
jgi:hypothetical protein